MPPTALGPIEMSVASRSLRTLRLQNTQRLAALVGRTAARPSACLGAARSSGPLSSSPRNLSTSLARQSGAPAMASQPRQYDAEIKDIADYVANKPIDSELAVSSLLPACRRSSARLPRPSLAAQLGHC